MAGAAHPPCWLFGLRWPGPKVYDSIVGAIGKTSKGTYTEMHLPVTSSRALWDSRTQKAFLFPFLGGRTHGLPELELWLELMTSEFEGQNSC